jgi:hypothetical protein
MMAWRIREGIVVEVRSRDDESMGWEIPRFVCLIDGSKGEGERR